MAEESVWRIEFWRDHRGRAPVQDLILGLDRKMRAKAQRNIALLQQQGSNLRMPLARPVVGHDFSELRIQTGGNNVRIFYFFSTGRRIVLLHGFMKKDQRIPTAEIAVAARRMSEYFRDPR